MELMSGLALVLLVLVGYSSGAAIAGRGKEVSPGLWDMGVVVLSWIGALGTRSALGRWTAILVWLVVALLVSAFLTALRRGRYGDRQESDHGSKARSLLRWAWDGWKAFGAAMGNYQGRMLFTFFYFVVVAPFGLGLRLFSDPLTLRPGRRTSSWVQRPPAREGLKAAREQF